MDLMSHCWFNSHPPAFFLHPKKPWNIIHNFTKLHENFSLAPYSWKSFEENVVWIFISTLTGAMFFPFPWCNFSSWMHWRRRIIYHFNPRACRIREEAPTINYLGTFRKSKKLIFLVFEFLEGWKIPPQSRGIKVNRAEQQMCNARQSCDELFGKFFPREFP